MIYFALTILGLKTAGHILAALGVEFKNKKEETEYSKTVRFLVHATFVIAYGYIISHFITLK